jgi:hypothetical protein
MNLENRAAVNNLQPQNEKLTEFHDGLLNHKTQLLATVNDLKNQQNQHNDLKNEHVTQMQGLKSLQASNAVQAENTLSHRRSLANHETALDNLQALTNACQRRQYGGRVEETQGMEDGLRMERRRSPRESRESLQQVGRSQGEVRKPKCQRRHY